jgi:DNA polymerase-1
MKKLVIIDINNFIYRAFFGIQQRLTAPDGTPVNAVYGVFNMLHKLLQGIDATAVIVAQDSKQSLRKALYPQYKENRSKMPDELRKQIALVNEMLSLLNFTLLEVPGYEADDIISGLAKKFYHQFDEIYIATGDKDLMQLVNDKVKCIDTMKDKIYTAKEVQEKLGVLPHQVVDFLALLGDSSDNIPGVTGIGEKTAVKLISQFGSINEIYARIQELPENKTKINLINQEAQARLSYDLASLKDVTIPDSLPEYVRSNRPELKEFFLRLNMKSAVEKLNL